MTLDLDIGAEAEMIRDAVRDFCQQALGEDFRTRRLARFSPALWQQLADLGVLGIGTPAGVGGALELGVAAEELGRAGCPGPLPQCVFAQSLLPADDVEAIAAGSLIVALGVPPLLAWAPHAQRFIGLCGDGAELLEVREIEPVDTLGREDWGRVYYDRATPLGDAAPALTRYHLVVGAWQLGAGLELLDTACAHARERRQFGCAIAEFQAVAYPLADAHCALSAARTLLRVSAYRMDRGDAAAAGLAAAARLAADRAARHAALTAHQTLGAYGVIEEGPVVWLSRRIQQLAAQAPSARDALQTLPLDVVTALDPVDTTN